MKYKNSIGMYESVHNFVYTLQNINQEDLNYRRVMYFSPVNNTFNGLKKIEIKEGAK